MAKHLEYKALPNITRDVAEELLSRVQTKYKNIKDQYRREKIDIRPFVLLTRERMDKKTRKSGKSEDEIDDDETSLVRKATQSPSEASSQGN